MMRRASSQFAGASLALSREQFFHGDAPGDPCPEIIDLTGLGRILVYGPFITIPRGIWTATIRLDLCSDAATRPFRMDVASGTAITQTPFTAKGPGALSVQARHEVDAEAPLELRLWVMKPTFHGQLRFLDATLRRADV